MALSEEIIDILKALHKKWPDEETKRKTDKLKYKRDLLLCEWASKAESLETENERLKEVVPKLKTINPYTHPDHKAIWEHCCNELSHQLKEVSPIQETGK